MSSSPTERRRLVDVTMPQMGVSVAEGTVIAWRVAGRRPDRGRRDDLRDLDRQDRHRGPIACRAASSPRSSSRWRDGRGRGSAGADRVERLATAPRRLTRRSAGRGSAGARPAATRRRDRTRQAAHAPAPAATARRVARRTARPVLPVVQRIAPSTGPATTGTGRGGAGRPQAGCARPCAESGAAVRSRRCTSRARTGRSPRRRPRSEPAGRSAGPLSRMRRQIGEHMKRSLETAATARPGSRST